MPRKRKLDKVRLSMSPSQLASLELLLVSGHDFLNRLPVEVLSDRRFLQRYWQQHREQLIAEYEHKHRGQRTAWGVRFFESNDPEVREQAERSLSHAIERAERKHRL